MVVLTTEQTVALTDTGRPPETELEWALQALRHRQPRYKTFRDYYAGRTPLAFVTEEFAEAFQRIVDEVNYNRCKRLIGAHADRLQVTSFAVEQGAKDLADKALAIWSRNRMDVKAGQVHIEALSLGDGYVIVWPDETGEARIYPQWGDRVAVLYDQDEPDQVAGAVKVWRRRDKRWRVNWYGEDALFKFVSRSNTADAGIPEKEDKLEQWQEDNEAWPLPYPEQMDRVPVFHFANDPDLDNVGVSELGDVLNRQDHLNKTLANLLISGEAYALPQWWLAGVDAVRNPDTGKYEPPFDVDSKLWMFGTELAKAGQFDPANLEHLIDELHAIDDQISSISGVPVYWLRPMGDPPSGESLKTLEAPFSRKLLDRQHQFGNAWEDVMHFCLALEGEAMTGVQLRTVWDPAEPRSEREFWEIAQMKMAAGIPEEQIWQEGGYSADEIARFKKQAEEQRQANAEQMAGMLAQRQFDRGGDFGGAGEEQEQSA